MCLLAVLSRVHPDGPLVVGANRDELLAREAVPMTRLGGDAPGTAVIGGRDLLAGGTWLAVGRHGVMAALTNQPSPVGRDASRRSRGELPLRAVAHGSAREAAGALVAAIDPRDYNPCWLLVGDRRSLHYLAIGDEPLVDEELPPGLWVLENRPLRAASPKADAVRAALADAASHRGEALWSLVRGVLANHAVPPGVDEAARQEQRESGMARPAALFAPCVHAGLYGTRSSTMVVVPAAEQEPPQVRYAAGPPCTHPFLDAAPFFA